MTSLLGFRIFYPKNKFFSWAHCKTHLYLFWIFHDFFNFIIYFKVHNVKCKHCTIVFLYTQCVGPLRDGSSTGEKIKQACYNSVCTNPTNIHFPFIKWILLLNGWSGWFWNRYILIKIFLSVSVCKCLWVSMSVCEFPWF